MGTIAQEITRIQNAKSAIRESIIGKGVTVPSDALISTYSDYVDAIPTGGGGNVFDDSNMLYLCYQGRFLNNLDDIYNSTRSNLSHWSLSNFANGSASILELTSTQAQKIINIVQKFIECGDKKTNINNFMQFIRITDDDNPVVFRPTISDRFSYFNMSSAFDSVEGKSGKHVNFTVDFSNIYNKILSHTSNNFNGFVFVGTNIDVHIVDLPVNLLNSSLTIGATTYAGKGAVVDITTKGAAAYSINISSCTRMTVEKCVDFFNGLNAKAVSRTVTITIPTTLYNQLTEEQKQIITDKNYVLASA